MFYSIWQNLYDFFYELIFYFQGFIFQLDFWLADEFELFLSQDQFAFFIVLSVLILYFAIIFFTIWLMYKILKGFINLFV